MLAGSRIAKISAHRLLRLGLTCSVICAPGCRLIRSPAPRSSLDEGDARHRG
jgi:hypothetical protein